MVRTPGNADQRLPWSRRNMESATPGNRPQSYKSCGVIAVSLLQEWHPEFTYLDRFMVTALSAGVDRERVPLIYSGGGQTGTGACPDLCWPMNQTWRRGSDGNCQHQVHTCQLQWAFQRPSTLLQLVLQDLLIHPTAGRMASQPYQS